MKKLFAVLSAILLLLSGCGLMPEAPKALQINSKTYKTGFYGALFPHEYSLTEQTLQGDGFTLVRIAHDTFALYHADVGPYTEGAIYCEESLYAQVSAYYADPTHYRYYCMLDGARAHTEELNGVDAAMFDALLDFSDASCYDPFDILHNSAVETVELPMPDNAESTRMVFYKESDDGLFCSTKGIDWYIIDHSLFMVYQYDYGHGEYEKLIAVKAPEDISAYFISLTEPFLK